MHHSCGLRPDGSQFYRLQSSRGRGGKLGRFRGCDDLKARTDAGPEFKSCLISSIVAWTLAMTISPARWSSTPWLSVPVEGFRVSGSSSAALLTPPSVRREVEGGASQVVTEHVASPFRSAAFTSRFRNPIMCRHGCQRRRNSALHSDCPASIGTTIHGSVRCADCT